MKPEIKFKRVVVDDERAYKIISINGVKHDMDLPTEYLAEGTRFSMCNGAFTIVSFHIEITFAIGDIIKDEMLYDLKQQMIIASSRLYNINQRIASDAEGWKGNVTITLEE